MAAILFTLSSSLRRSRRRRKSIWVRDHMYSWRPLFTLSSSLQEGLVSACRRCRRVHLCVWQHVLMAAICLPWSDCMTTCTHGGQFVYLVLFLGRIWRAPSRRRRKVSVCMTTCTYGGYFIYLVLFLGRIWWAPAEGVENVAECDRHIDEDNQGEQRI